MGLVCRFITQRSMLCNVCSVTNRPCAVCTCCLKFVSCRAVSSLYCGIGDCKVIDLFYRAQLEHLEQVQLCFHHLHSRIMLHSTCSSGRRILCLYQVCEKNLQVFILFPLDFLFYLHFSFCVICY